MNLSSQIFNDKVSICLKEIHALLVKKNNAYGNSALEPSRIFSKADSIEQLKVRIDDKLSRIKNQGFDDSDDTLNDLIGYLVLLKIALTEKDVFESAKEKLERLKAIYCADDKESKEKESQASVNREKRLDEHLKVQPFGEVPKEFTEIKPKVPDSELDFYFHGDF